MGLVSNCSRLYFNGCVEGSAHALMPGMWNSYRQFEKFIMPEMSSAVLQTAANPPGFYLPGIYQPPILAGEMSFRNDGAGSIAANLYPTRPMAIDFTGAGDLTAEAALVISMLLALTGSGTLEAAIEGRLNMSADFTGAGDLDATIGALGNMIANLTGTGDLEAVISAYGNMEIDIVVTGAGLSTANIGEAVWGALAAANNDSGTMGEKLNDAGSASNPWTEVIESGYTATEVMKILLAVAAGKSSGGGTTNIKFRDVADTLDRIDATVDSSGNRTAITLDAT